MSPTTEEPRPAAAPRRAGGTSHTNALVLYLCLGGLAFAVLQSLVAPALATIAYDLQASTSDASWVLTAYLLSAAVLTPIISRLGDMIGKRKTLIAVLATLLVGTLVAALAPNLGVLIAARVLQGAAGAILPLSIGIVRDELPPEKVGVTIGLVSAVFGVGIGVGIVAAGPIVEHLSWHWLFWLPLALVVVALLGVVFGTKDTAVRTPGRLDLLGTATLTTSLVSLLLAIGKGAEWGWGSGKTLGLLALGVVAMVGFVLIELRVSAPLVDVRLMRLRGVWTANVVSIAFGFVMFGTFVLVPNLLQLPEATGYGFGKSVTQAGLFLLPTVVMMIVSAPVAALLETKGGPKTPMVIAAVFAMVAFIIPTISHEHTWQLVVSGLLTGAGVGLAFSSMSNAIIEAVPAAQTTEAIGVNTITRTIGSSIGTAVIAALLTGHATPQGMPTDDAFSIGFIACIAVGAIAIIAALVAPSARRTASPAAPATDDELMQLEMAQ